MRTKLETQYVCCHFVSETLNKTLKRRKNVEIQWKIKLCIHSRFTIVFPKSISTHETDSIVDSSYLFTYICLGRIINPFFPSIHTQKTDENNIHRPCRHVLLKYINDRWIIYVTKIREKILKIGLNMHQSGMNVWWIDDLFSRHLCSVNDFFMNNSANLGMEADEVFFLSWAFKETRL